MPLSPDEIEFLKGKGYSADQIAKVGGLPAPQEVPKSGLAPDEEAFLRSKGYSDAQIASVAQKGAQNQAVEPQPSPQAHAQDSGSAQGSPESQTAQVAGQPRAASDSTFFAPAAITERAKEGAIGAFPFARAATNALQGKDAYQSGAEGIGEMAGDVGGTALGVASGGILPLLKFAGLGSALNAIGVPQGAEAIGNQLERPGNAVNIPSKVAGIEGLGTLLNFLARTPGGVASTAIQVAPYALAGKAMEVGKPAAENIGAEPTPAPETPSLTPQQEAAKALQEKGYPITKAHLEPGDVSLKAALDHPGAQPEAQAYLKRLEDASRSDIGSALDVGGQTSQQLGEKVGGAFQNALGQRAKSYQDMLALADNPRGELNTGVGEFTHTGKSFNSQISGEMAKRGLNLDAPVNSTGTTLRQKALVGGGLTQYDVPAGMNADDATAAIRFGDLASQKAASPVELDSLAKNFAKTEKIFQPGQGGASSGGFLRSVQNAATDFAAETLKKRDEMAGPAQAPSYPAWAAQRANWAKTADLVGQFENKFSNQRTRLTGETMYNAEKISPEQVFQKEFAGAGADKISAFKGFLKDNGQDPAVVEEMGKDWLADQANRAKDPVNALEGIWRKMTPEYKSALFSPQTIVGVEDALARTRQAKAPLEVMGTQAKGGSQTAAKLAIAKAMSPGSVKGAVGGITGSMLGGPLGGLVGGGAGILLDQMQQAKALQNARDILTKAPDIAPASAPKAPLTTQAANVAKAPIPGTAGIPPYLADMIRRAVSRPGAQAR